jgi:hypothetical protein
VTRSDWILPAAPQPVVTQAADLPPGGGAGRTQPAYMPPPAQPFGAGAPAGPSGPPRQPPRRHDGNRPGRPRALWILLPLLLVIAVAAVLLTRPFSHPAQRGTAAPGASAPSGSPAGAGSGAAASASPAASGSAPASPAAASERQAAAGVAAMLSRSVAERSAISSAAEDVAGCGPNLVADPKVFDDAVSSRRALLAQLSALPGRAALPAPLLGDLTRAWQASISADQAYARWAADENTRGCTADDTSDPGYRAAAAPDAAATRNKTAFTGAWNRVAARYGLARYQPDQL